MTFQSVGDISLSPLDDDAALVARMRAQGPMNIERLYQVMEQQGYDGLVLGDPINIFHATGHWPFQGRSRPGAPPNMFVVINRDPDVPAALVAPKFYYYYTVVDAEFSSQRPAYIYGDLSVPASSFYPDRGEADIDAVELSRGGYLDAALANQPQIDTMTNALAAALEDYGLRGGALGYDYPAIPGWTEGLDGGARWRQADDLLRQVRLVKSPLEIALMRRASAVNVRAAHALMQGLREGADYREIRRLFFTEAAARGGEGVSLTIDRISNELSPKQLRKGQAFAIDAVSQTNHYFGDYGRTLFLGEPTAAMTRAVEAMHIGWSAIREKIKPGVSYSQILAYGREAVRKSGYDHVISFTPHSVGLMHTDEPIDWRNGIPGKADLILEKGMILSIDCPVLETGMGGSAHLEDLTLVTEDGSEPIHPVAGSGLIL